MYSISSDSSPDAGSDSSGTDSHDEDGDDSTEHDAELSSHHDEQNNAGARRSVEQPRTVKKKEEDQDWQPHGEASQEEDYNEDE